MDSIRADHAVINAQDPQALTRLLDLPEFVVTHVEVAHWLGWLVLHVRAQAPSARCPRCEQACTHVHQYHSRSVRDLPWNGQTCWLQIAVRRFKCPTCRRPFTERFSTLPSRARITPRYAAHLVAACRQTSVQAVARREQVGYKTVESYYYQAAAARYPWGAPSWAVRRLGIDEIALRKGQGHYRVVLSDLDRGCVLAVLPDREQATLVAYLGTWSAAARAAVMDVALDFWAPYHGAVRRALPAARITGDRFHLMRHVTAVVNQVRRREARRLRDEDRAEVQASRWLWLKNEADLGAAEQVRLIVVGAALPALERAHALKERLRAILETAPDRATGEQELRGWLAEVRASKERAWAPVVKMVQRWWEVITNYFEGRLSSGGVEGLNTKIKLIKRQAFGFRNDEHFRLRVLMECDGT